MASNYYRKKAETQLNPQYDMRKKSLDKMTESQVGNLEAQRGGINTSFQDQIDDNTRNTQLNQNAYENNSLSRGIGIGRSTITTSGLAGIQDRGTRLETGIKTQRTNALNQLDAQIAGVRNNAEAERYNLSAQKEQEIASLMERFRSSDISAANSRRAAQEKELAKRQGLELEGKIASELTHLTSLQGDEGYNFVYNNAGEYLNPNSPNYLGKDGYNFLMSMMKNRKDAGVSSTKKSTRRIGGFLPADMP